MRNIVLFSLPLAVCLWVTLGHTAEHPTQSDYVVTLESRIADLEARLAKLEENLVPRGELADQSEAVAEYIIDHDEQLTKIASKLDKTASYITSNHAVFVDCVERIKKIENWLAVNSRAMQTNHNYQAAAMDTMIWNNFFQQQHQMQMDHYQTVNEINRTSIITQQLQNINHSIQNLR